MRSPYISAQNLTPSSFSPSSFSPAFDMVLELTNNREHYIGKEQSTVYGLPTYIQTCIDRVRYRVEPEPPGISTTFCCAVHHGLSVIETSDIIDNLITLRRQMEDISAPALTLEHLLEWFRKFPISIPDGFGTGTVNLNIYSPEHIKHRVGNLKNRLGATVSSLLAISCMVGLSEQTSIILPEHKLDLDRAIKGLWGNASLRLELAKVFVTKVREMEKEK
jgi:hypothetical protein